MRNQLKSIPHDDLIPCLVKELLAAKGISMPRNIHEVIAHLASRLACWDDR